jgi:hypothetical protein
VQVNSTFRGELAWHTFGHILFILSLYSFKTMTLLTLDPASGRYECRKGWFGSRRSQGQISELQLVLAKDSRALEFHSQSQFLIKLDRTAGFREVKALEVAANLVREVGLSGPVAVRNKPLEQSMTTLGIAGKACSIFAASA